MGEFLSQPYWDGISAIVGIVSLILAILYDRKTAKVEPAGISWLLVSKRFLAATGGSLGAGLALVILNNYNLIHIQDYVVTGILLGAPAGVVASVVRTIRDEQFAAGIMHWSTPVAAEGSGGCQMGCWAATFVVATVFFLIGALTTGIVTYLLISITVGIFAGIFALIGDEFLSKV